MNSNPAPSFDEPLEMLAACHERIEDKLKVLERLAPHLEKSGCDPEAKSAAHAVLRYFDTSGVWHHQDEDEDFRSCARAPRRAAARRSPPWSTSSSASTRPWTRSGAACASACSP
jgi:hypothetical protein